MKIAFVTDKSAPFFVGGYENRIFELARRLANRHEVRVLTSLDRPERIVDGVRFERVCPLTFQRDISGERSLPHSALFAIAASANMLAQYSPDVVVVEAIPYAHLVTVRPWIRRVGRVVLLDVVEAWRDYPYTRFPGLGILSRRAIHHCLASGLGWADGVLAISHSTANSLIRNFATDSRRISLIPLGLSVSPVESGQADGESFKEFDVATVGRLVPSKRTKDLVAALATLRDRTGWSGRAVIIGSGPLRSVLQGQISRLGLDRQVRLTGFVPEAEKRELLRRSRAFVLTSEREGFSLATLEAMGQGLPVVVARPAFAEVFGTADFVHDQRNGLFFPVGDTDALAGQLQTILTDANTEQTLSQAARATAASYSWDTLTVRFEQVMEGAVTAALNRPQQTDPR